MEWYYYPFGSQTDEAYGVLKKLLSGVIKNFPDSINSADNKFGAIVTSGGTSPTNFVSILSHDHIYIVGHATSNENVLGGENNEIIKQTEIVNRLISNKFHPYSGGKILITLWGCHSGKGDNSSLAYKVAQAIGNARIGGEVKIVGFRPKVGTRSQDGFLTYESNGQYIPISPGILIHITKAYTSGVNPTETLPSI